MCITTNALSALETKEMGQKRNELEEWNVTRINVVAHLLVTLLYQGHSLRIGFLLPQLIFVLSLVLIVLDEIDFLLKKKRCP